MTENPGSHALIDEIAQALTAMGGFELTRDGGADLAITSTVADAAWKTGKKKVDYSAVISADEGGSTLLFWEMLKEVGSGFSFGSLGFEMSATAGKKRWGTKHETVVGPEGVAVDYSFEYGKTRSLVEEIAAKHGWRVKVVLLKKNAMK